MTTYDMTALETQLNTLDQDTAQRVTRLVFECNASLDMALLAVREANMAMSEAGGQLSLRRKVAHILSTHWSR